MPEAPGSEAPRDLLALKALLDHAVASGLLSGCVALVGSGDAVLGSVASGFEDPATGVPASRETRFDFASLTKPFIATLALRLDSRRELLLRTRIGSLVPAAHPALAPRTVASLLRHASGLRAWTPFYARCRDRTEARELLLSGDLLGASCGTYSDCGYLLWGFLAEERLGEPLATLLAREVLAPLGLATVAAQPGVGPHLARSLCDTGREVSLAAEQGMTVNLLPPPPPGRAQDGNARFLGGLCGHAGLFGTAEDLWRLAAEWLQPGKLLTSRQTALALAGRGERVLGWARRRVRGAAGPALGPRTFGHLGFTGGSLWIDPDRDRIFVLLGHRVSPFADLTPLRQEFHRLASEM